jgi:hypothetical protein
MLPRFTDGMKTIAGQQVWLHQTRCDAKGLIAKGLVLLGTRDNIYHCLRSVRKISAGLPRFAGIHRDL